MFGNPFYRAPQAQAQMPFQNVGNLMSQFNQFRSMFQGDPKQKVQELLQSGQMTNEQFNQLSQMAQQFQQFIH